MIFARRQEGVKLTARAISSGPVRGVVNIGERAMWSGGGISRLLRAGQNRGRLLAVCGKYYLKPDQ